MTIAIGYHCWKGVVVVADTLVIIGPDVQEGTKLDVKWTQSGAFAFVNSSMDANATATLIGNIFHVLETGQFIYSYRHLGDVIKASMTDWRRGFGGRKPPETQLILAAKLKGHVPALFLCEPPNTFLEKDDYVAVGAGASVTDPLYNTLFGNNGGAYSDVHTVLRRLCYLIYRAKKDSWMCGKRTHSAFVHRDDKEPSHIDQHDMADAEQVASGLDFLLSSASVFALEDDESAIDRHATDLGDMLKSFKALRSITFHDEHGEALDTHKPEDQD